MNILNVNCNIPAEHTQHQRVAQNSQAALHCRLRMECNTHPSMMLQWLIIEAVHHFRANSKGSHLHICSKHSKFQVTLLPICDSHTMCLSTANYRVHPSSTLEDQNHKHTPESLPSQPCTPHMPQPCTRQHAFSAVGVTFWTTITLYSSTNGCAPFCAMKGCGHRVLRKRSSASVTVASNLLLLLHRRSTRGVTLAATPVPGHVTVRHQSNVGQHAGTLLLWPHILGVNGSAVLVENSSRSLTWSNGDEIRRNISTA
ncbi:hypothetical protein COO60DRAFT_1507755 [Scenedesmus sp. NREL 46B-D3]|nr:hypothetical protein COO60DRAFT_1507755 [Scenedesmus sp. NREL 46B-D3]